MLYVFKFLYHKICLTLIVRSLKKEGVIFAFRNIGDDPSFIIASDVSVNSVEFTVNELRQKTELFYEFMKLKGKSSVTRRDLQMEDLYARQVKVKLTEFLRSSLQLRDWLALRSGNNIIISDAQTIAILKDAFEFFSYETNAVNFIVSKRLTFIIYMNSFFLRIMSFVLMWSGFFYAKKTYYVRENSGKPCLLVTLPNTAGDEFYANYVKKLEDLFELVVLPLDNLEGKLHGYVARKADRRFTLANSNMFFGPLFNGVGFVRDCAVIQVNIRYFFASLNTVDYIFANENVSFLLNRQQVKLVNNALVLLAFSRKIPIIAHVFEEVYYYDAALLPSEDYAANNLVPSLVDKPTVMSMRAPLMSTRFSDDEPLDRAYLKKVLKLEKNKKVVFYASDPGALTTTPKQRISTELFLMSAFAADSDHTLVIKIHPSDDGMATHRAYLSAGEPLNVLLVANTSRRQYPSTHFKVFSTFHFNAALVSCDAFITSTSSSVLQAVMLGVKVGLVDTINHGLFRDLVTMNRAKLIDDKASLNDFLSAGVVNPEPGDFTRFYGLSNKQDTEFPQQLLQLYNLIR